MRECVSMIPTGFENIVVAYLNLRQFTVRDGYERGAIRRRLRREKLITARLDRSVDGTHVAPTIVGEAR